MSYSTLIQPAKRSIWPVVSLCCVGLVVLVFALRSELMIFATSFADEWRILLEHAWVTTSETALGFAAAFIAGVIGGVFLQAWPRLLAILWPSILLAQITPKVAIAPLLLVWFGFGMLSKVTIAFLISFFPIFANSLAGLNSVDPDIRDLALSMRATKWSYFLRFLIPHAMPRIFAGARIAITFAVVGAVVGEFVGADHGLGYLVLLSARNLNSNLMALSVVSLALLGMLFYVAVALAEYLTIPWYTRRRRHQSREAVGAVAAAEAL